MREKAVCSRNFVFFSFSQSIRIAVLAIDFVALLYNLTVIFRRCQDVGRILFRKLTLPVAFDEFHNFIHKANYADVYFDTHQLSENSAPKSTVSMDFRRGMRYTCP